MIVHDNANCNDNDYLDSWFPRKRFIPVLKAPKECPLTFNGRLVYSYLVFKLRDDGHVSLMRIVEITALHKRTVRQELDALLKLNLVEKEDGRQGGYRAQAIPPELFGETAGYYRHYPLAHGKAGPISPSANTLFWVVHSLQNKRNTMAGIRTMTGLAKDTAFRAVHELRDAGLMDWDGAEFRLFRPTGEALAAWQNRNSGQVGAEAPQRPQEAPARPQAKRGTDGKGKGAGGRFTALAALGDIAGFADDEDAPDVARLVTDKAAWMQKDFGMLPGELVDFWREGITTSVRKYGWEATMRNLMESPFDRALREYNRVHLNNGKTGSCFKWLMHNLNDLF